MRASIGYGTLSLPDSWEDRSIYQWTSSAGPRDKARSSVVVTRVSLAGGLSVGNQIEGQLRVLDESLEDFVLHSREPWSHPRLGAVPRIDYSFELAEAKRLRQVQLFLPLPDQGAGEHLCITMTADVNRAEAELPKLRAIFDSFVGA